MEPLMPVASSITRLHVRISVLLLLSLLSNLLPAMPGIFSLP
jgi:hypothetical protein